MGQYASTPAGSFSRRGFLGTAAAGCAGLALSGCATGGDGSEDARTRPRGIVYASRGKLGVIDEDGGDPRFIEPGVPDQVSWHHGPVFADGKRMILMSVEGTRTWEHNVRSHLWIYDFDRGRVDEIATKDPPAVYMPACALLPGEERLVVNPIIDGEQRVYTMDLDGSNQVAVTHEGDGFSYCVVAEPRRDPARVSRRYPPRATRSSQQSWTGPIAGSSRALPGISISGRSGSHDGEWLLYLDCHTSGGPGHDWADLCIGRPDGSEYRVVTYGQRHWFGTSYGGPDTRGSGSNMPRWSPRRNVCTYTRALPDSRTAWQYADDRPDTDHFNRDFQPELARGGTEICLFDPFTGEIEQLTRNDPPVWDFRTAWSPDGGRIAFCRSPVGCASELWVMDADGRNAQFLTRGCDDLGADHPSVGMRKRRWAGALGFVLSRLVSTRLAFCGGFDHHRGRWDSREPRQAGGPFLAQTFARTEDKP